MAFLPNTPKVTRNLIIINIIVYIATLLSRDMMISTFSLFYPTSRYFHIWQFVTYMFMHGSFWHIFFNMYTLFIFGSVIENMIGEKKFLVFYFLCGFGAAALHLGIDAVQVSGYMNDMADGIASAAGSYAALKSVPMLGASGAIYGVLLAYAMLFPDSRMTLIFPPVTFSARTMVLIFVGIELLTGILGAHDGVAHFAHLGGMIVGFLLIFYWRKAGKLFDRDSWF